MQKIRLARCVRDHDLVDGLIGSGAYWPPNELRPARGRLQRRTPLADWPVDGHGSRQGVSGLESPVVRQGLSGVLQERQTCRNRCWKRSEWGSGISNPEAVSPR